MPPFYDKTACHTKYLPRVQFHMLQFHIIERSRLPPRRSMHRAGALLVKSYAFSNSLAVCYLYHSLHNGVCGDGNTGPLIHQDGAARAVTPGRPLAINYYQNRTYLQRKG
jgi:hypothetical protein